jgi:hypothetical protein
MRATSVKRADSICRRMVVLFTFSLDSHVT